MWTNQFVYNLTDVSGARLLVASEASDVNVEVTYLGAKTGVLGSGPAEAVQPAVFVPAHGTAGIDIDLYHPAFKGGYGAVRARALGAGGPADVIPIFLALSGERNLPDANPVSGAAFVGTKFRLPLIASALRLPQVVRLAITNAGALSTNVAVAAPDGSFGGTWTVQPFETLRWDGQAQGQTFPAGGQIEVVSQGNVPIVVSAFVVRDYIPFHVHLPAATL